MSQFRKRYLSAMLACSMILSNTSLILATDFEINYKSQYTTSDDVQEISNMYEGTYSVPINLQKSATDTGAITSRAVNQFTSPASLIVDEQGVISLEMELTRNTTEESTSTYQYYPKGTIQYKVSGSDDWIDAKVLETHAFSVTASGKSRSDTRPSLILIEGLTESDLEGIEFKYEEYRIRAGTSNATYATNVGYIKIDASNAEQSQTEEPVVSISGANVSITCGTANSVIYYTINGGAEQTYTEPFKVSGASDVVVAYAKTTGYSNSVTVEKTYDATQTKTLGSNAKTYGVGTYDITVAAKKEGSLNDASSYDGLVVSDALLEVNADGEVNMILEFQHGTMMEMDCYLEDVTYYNLSGSKVSVEVIETFTENSYINTKDYSPKVVRVPLLDNETEYFVMNAQAGTDSWYINYHDFVILINEFVDTVDNDGDVEIPEFVAPEDTGFFFGVEKIQLEQGRYIVPTNIMKSTNHEELSMTDDAMVNEYVILEVYEDATAEITAEFQSMVYNEATDYVVGARYYLSDEANKNYYEQAIINSTDGDGNITSATFKITNKALDGLYTAYQSAVYHTDYIDAYMSFDFANAKAYDVSGFGSDEVEYTKGEYDVSVALKKASNLTEDSMATDALAEIATLEVLENGNANLTFELSSLEFDGTKASATDIKFYTSPRVDENHIKDAKINATDEAGNPTSLTVEINHKEADGVYINLKVLGMTQDAYITIDYTKTLPVATGIEIVSDNHKKEYYVDDVLSVEDLEIKVTYDDGSTQTVSVTSQMVSGFDSTNAASSQKLTITYGELSTSYTVEIKEIIAKPLTATVSSQEHKTQYVVGDELDLTGLTIDVKYDDDSTHTVAVTSEMITGFDSTNAISSQALTITYKNTISTTLDIEIVAKQATNIEIVSDNHKKEYYVDDVLSVEDLQIKVTYNNGETETLDVNSNMVSGFDSTNAVSSQKLTITYGELSTSYTVEIKATIVLPIEATVSSQGHKTQYVVGDELDLSGLTIDVKYDDGSTQTVSVTSQMVSGFDSTNAVSSQKLTITYGELSTSYTVEIIEKEISSVGFGSSEVELEKGEYNVPVAMKKSTNLTEDSMASTSLFETGVLNVLEDGSAEITLLFGMLELDSIQAYATDLKYYDTNDTTGNLTDATVNEVDENGYPTSITITIPNNSWDGIYINMDIAGMSNHGRSDAFIQISYAEIDDNEVNPDDNNSDDENLDDENLDDENLDDENLDDENLDDNNSGGSSSGGSSSGGSSSGSSSNNSSTTQPEVEPEVETEDVLEEKVETEASVEAGVASVTKSESEISDLIENLGDNASDSVISLVVTSEEVADVVEMTLTSASALLLAENTSGVKIETQIAEIEIPVETLKNIINQFEGDVKIIIENNVQEVSQEVQEIIGNRPVIDFVIEIDGKKVSEFSQNLTVKIPYELAENENSKKLGVLYLSEDNEPTKMQSARYEDGFIIFETEHFSTFAITYQDLIAMFSDVLDEHWFAEAIEFVLEEDLFNGTSSDNFSPNSEMTRAMIMTVLHRLSGDTEFTNDENWYTAGVEWAVFMGISDGTNLNENLTREQLATLLYRYSILELNEEIQVEADLSSYDDIEDVSSWAKEALIWANSEGIMLGTTEKTLEPQNNTTRAEVATMLMRYIK